MKKLVLTLIAAGAFLLAPSISQAQSTPTKFQPETNAELVQLTEQLNQVAANLSQVAHILDVHSNTDVNETDSKLTQSINKLQKNLKNAVQAIEKIKADRAIHSSGETQDDDLQDLV